METASDGLETALGLGSARVKTALIAAGVEVETVLGAARVEVETGSGADWLETALRADGVEIALAPASMKTALRLLFDATGYDVDFPSVPPVTAYCSEPAIVPST